MEGNANKGILKPVIAATITDPAKLATKMAKRLFQNGSEVQQPWRGPDRFAPCTVVCILDSTCINTRIPPHLPAGAHAAQP